MRVSTQFPLAVHALLMLDHFDNDYLTSECIAGSAGCNPVIIRNIFAKLKESGLILVKPGRGASLAKAPSDISLWDVYTAVETGETGDIFKFHPNPSTACPVGGNIYAILSSHFDTAVDALRKELSGVSLARISTELETKTN